ncbi:DNA-binding transcriptional regulator, PucR family [Micromonospora carbonacea]|uniref:DNA-binding transcriptional regulator, PucR family n=2 Tax=Micromonospora carbonacea TaxID=47853 RepID=A0A1C4V9A6_9ACTN|nr:DNA-binding transcriptional regulator, PucR family [Micromonospora carbonacea]
MTAVVSPRGVSIADLLAVLESAGLRLASSDEGRKLGVTRAVLYDPCSAVDRLSGGVLVAPGLRSADDAARGVVARAAGQGFGAVVVKAYGEAVTPLVRAADAAGIALLVVSDAIEWLHLHSLLNNALVTATHVGRSLSLPAVGDLFALAGATAAIVGGATAIEDTSRRVLAYSHLPGQAIDEERQRGILGRRVPDLPYNDEQYRQVYASRGVVRFAAPPLALPRLAVAVRAGTDLLGSIWVIDPAGSLGARAEEALLAAAPVAALHLLHARSFEALARQQRGEFVRQILENAGRADDAADALGLETRRPYAVLAFAPVEFGLTESTPTAGRLLDMVTLHCEARIGHTGLVMIGGTLFVLVAGPHLGRPEVLTQLATEVVTAAGTSLRLRLLAGIGPTVDDLASVRGAHHEAARVIALLRQRPDLGPVATADRVSDQLVLAHLRAQLGSDPKLTSHRAWAVAAHDATRGTNYSQVLLAYFDAVGDVGLTAKRLSLHPNTVRYRLRRATELFHLDLADPEQVLPLWMALTVRSGGTAESAD